MATIKEVAKRAGVAVGTVSHVLTGAASVSPERRRRILAAMRDLDYHPNDIARSLKLNRSHMLGMVVSDITNPFFSQMVRGAEDAAMKHNYLLLTFNSDDQIDREKKILKVLRTRRVDGALLVVAPSHERPLHVAELIALGTPVVCLDRTPRGIRVDSVTVNNTKAAQECVYHLLDLGHRHIAMLTGSLLLETARERLQGYKNALVERGIPIDPELICEGNFRVESGYELTTRLLRRKKRPTAIFVSNGLMAIGVLKALAQTNIRCPQEIAVASFDDSDLSEVLNPSLTSVVQPAYEIGYRGVELLLERIEFPEKRPDGRSLKIRLETELRIRNSTMAPTGTAPNSI
jgi:LacI family transcriptional regulator